MAEALEGGEGSQRGNSAYAAIFAARRPAKYAFDDATKR